MIDWATVGASLIAAGGGGAMIVVGTFRWLGSKWIEARFATQLEVSRQQHATAIERLKFQIAGLLDRTQKLNQREFEILPDIWKKLDDAYVATAYLLSRWRTHPDLSRMSEPQFEEWLGLQEIANFQKQELRLAEPRDRVNLYSGFVKWIEVHKADVAVKEFLNTLSRGSIYLHPETFERIDEFGKRLAMAFHHHKVDLEIPRQPGDPVRNSAADSFRENGETWFKNLGDYLRNKYWGEASGGSIISGGISVNPVPPA